MDYVDYVAKTFYFHIWGLRHIRRSISRDIANTMAPCIDDTYLGYCNSLLHGAAEKFLNKLQRVQNKFLFCSANSLERTYIIHP